MIFPAIQSSDMLPGCKTSISSPVECWEPFNSFYHPCKLDWKAQPLRLGCMVLSLSPNRRSSEGELTPVTGANDHVEAKPAGRVVLSALRPHLYRPRGQFTARSLALYRQ